MTETKPTSTPAAQTVDAKLEDHPIAAVLPLLEGDELKLLVQDISENGLREPIDLFEDKILDGRNRYRACIKAGIEPISKNYDGDDPVGFVLSKNVRRRHLNESQRAFAGAQLSAGKSAGWTQAKLARALNVSERLIRDAATVMKNGVAELLQAVAKDEVKISAALGIAAEPADIQRKLVKAGAKRVREAAAQARQKGKQKRETSRAQSENAGVKHKADKSPGLTPVSPSVSPSAAPFRSNEAGAAETAQYMEGLGHDIDLTDITVSPGSASSSARPSEYALVRIPHRHPERDKLKKTLLGLRDEYNTDVIFKTLPQTSQAEAPTETHEKTEQTDHAA